MAGSIAFMYYVAGTIMISPDIIGAIPFWAVELAGVPILLALDIAMIFIYKFLAPKVCRVIRDKETKTIEQPIDEEKDSEENPFEEE